MNKDTKELQHRLNKDYLTIDDVKQQGGVGKVYLVVGNDLNTKYWFCKNKYENILIPTNDESYDSEIKHQFLIIGNGFDLHCGMGSSYTNFFNELFGISLGIKVNELIDSKWNTYSEEEKKQKIAEYANKENQKMKRKFICCYFKKKDISKAYRCVEENYLMCCKKRILRNIDNVSQEKLTSILNQINEKIFECQGVMSKWNMIFFIAKFFYLKKNVANWSDVEKMIFYVITLLFDEQKGLSNIYFDRFVKTIFLANNDKRDLSNEVLAELYKFEKEFAKFIQEKETMDYYENAKKTIEQIVIKDEKIKNSHIILDVFDFNYSLNEYDARHFLNLNSRISIYDWTNIHGIADYDRKFDEELPAPIFGVDLQELLSDSKQQVYKDLRLKFTKSYRLSTNHVNLIRMKDFQKEVDVITVVGHSLDKADYSYFEAIFDKYNLYSGEVRLEFYYPQGITKAEDYTRSIDALLTYYGQTLHDLHGESLFNKLMLERRLRVLPYGE